MSGAEPLAGARAALDDGDWPRALELLAEAGPAAEGAEGLELRAQAAYANGEFEASIAAWEDLHARFVAEGAPVEAARAAAMVAMYLMMDTGLMAPVRGWLRRAQRLLEGHEEAPAHALIALVRTYERFLCGDIEGARRHAASAIELGERQDVVPAVVIGRVAGARVELLDGDLDGGLELLDEVAVLLMSGEVDPLTTGMMYCELICAAQGLALHDRASEWTDVMDRWRRGAAVGGINGRCRVHRAEILRISGPCDLAEAEALGACEELRPWMRREFGWPLVELGNIRLRKGDLAGAEEAFLAAHEHAWSPQPGLALLRLAQGDVESAAALIADAIAHPFDYPWKERPPIGELRLAPLLDAQVEIAVAGDDLDTAHRAADELRSIAATYASPGLEAAAALAGARVALLRGDLPEAADGSSRAIAAWVELGAPFEAAAARMVLGDVRQRSGNTDAARIEWRAARAAFEAFGATRRAEEAARRLAQAPEPAPVSPAGSPTLATFRRDGGGRTVGFEGSTVTVRDLKGFRYLERLLAEPTREFHVLDLVAVEQGTLPTHSASPSADADTVAVGADTGLPVLDDEARAAYRRRLTEIDEDIDEAAQMNDMGRLELAQRDREYLVEQLAQAVGLGGRSRTTGGSAERARTSVTRSIRYAMARLGEEQPVLAAHLERCVRTGTYCSYAPDPLAPVCWEL